VKAVLELHPLVDAGTIFEPGRSKGKEALTSMLIDGLMPAFLELEQIRASVGRDIPFMNREQLYEDLARKLWKTYKGLMQNAVRLMGFDIGFLFENDKRFYEGSKEFRQANPELRPWFEEFVESVRASWQKELARFRNTWLEHPSGEPKQFAKFYRPDFAEELFRAVWQTIVNILPALLELRLPLGTKLIEQYGADGGPTWGIRFRYSHPAFKDTK
jgi:hypothetical protein